MVERLVRGPATVSQLAEPLAMSLPAVVQHLGVLESAGAVSTEKVGRVRTCQLQPEVLRRAETWLVAERTDWERRLDRLGLSSWDWMSSCRADCTSWTAHKKYSSNSKHKERINV